MEIGDGGTEVDCLHVAELGCLFIHSFGIWKLLETGH